MNDIITIDCEYLKKGFACAYLVKEKDECFFVDNNTNFAIPILLQTLETNNLKKENVRYLIVTHIHLDHAGATSELIKEFPNAIVLAHPKAAPHLINPKRIIEGASNVYGKENFIKLYGNISEIPESKVRVMKDEEILKFGKRNLKFIYTKGHANHHFVIHDSKSNSIFTGDSFGISYSNLRTSKGGFIFPSTTPTDFDANEAKLSIQKILNTGAEKAYLTHFGSWTEMKSGAEELIEGIEKMESILNKLIELELKDEEQKNFTENEINKYYISKLNSKNISTNEIDFLKEDIMINAQGINFAANRILRKKN